MQKSQMVPYIRLMWLKKSTTGQESEYEQSDQHIYRYVYILVKMYVHGYTHTHMYTRVNTCVCK